MFTDFRKGIDVKKKNLDKPIKDFFIKENGKYNLVKKYQIPEFQRPQYTWEKEKANEFIKSLLNNPQIVPQIHVGFLNNKGMILDGLQRLTSIQDYLNSNNQKDIHEILKLKIAIREYYLEKEDQAFKIFDSLNRGTALSEIDLQRGNGLFCHTLKIFRQSDFVKKVISKKTKDIQELEKRIASLIFLIKGEMLNTQEYSSQYKQVKTTEEWNMICKDSPEIVYQKYFTLAENILGKNVEKLKTDESSGFLFLLLILSLDEKMTEESYPHKKILFENISMLINKNFFDIYEVDIVDNTLADTRTRINRHIRFKDMLNQLLNNPEKRLSLTNFEKSGWESRTLNKLLRKGESKPKYQQLVDKVKSVKDKEFIETRIKAQQDLFKSKEKQKAVEDFKKLIKNEAKEEDVLSHLRKNNFLLTLGIGVEILADEHVGEAALFKNRGSSRGDFIAWKNGGLVSIEFKSPSTKIFQNKGYRSSGPWKLNPDIIHAAIQVHSNGEKFVENLNKNPKMINSLMSENPDIPLGALRSLMDSFLILGKDQDEEISSISENFEQKLIMEETWTYLRKVLNVQIITYSDFIKNINLKSG